jgi:hypothetical protein
MNLTNRPVTPKGIKRRKGAGKSERESPWYQFGTDKEFQDFVRKQPSAFSGKKENIVFAHHRTAENSGTAIKPPFSGIPLTWEEHALQHRIGQYAFMPKWWWKSHVNMYLNEWVASINKKKQNNLK